MSDFLFTPRRRPPGELLRALARYPALPGGELRELHGDWGSLALVQPAFEAAAWIEGGGHISIVVGGPVLRLPGVSAGRVDIGERRRLLHERLADPLATPGDWLDGQFALLVAGAAPRVVTDRFGFVPVFHARNAAGDAVVGTHVDALALAAGLERDIDLVSAADLVSNLTCTFPYTLYEGVRQLRPGAVHEWRDGVHREEVYWAPAEQPRYGTLAAAAHALRDGVRESVAAACRETDRATVLLSGGEDSRVVLGAMPRHLDVRAAIYAEWESREVRVARRVAKACGARVAVAIRAPDHYERGFPDVVRLLGSHHNFIDFHGLGLSDALALDEEPVVLGGLSADSLLKGIYSPTATDAWRSARPELVRADLLDAVDARRATLRRELALLRPQSADEWLQLWPFSMRKHGGNVDGNRRKFRNWEVYHATDVLEVAAAAPLAWKQHRRLFRQAVRPLLARTRFVPHAEYRFPYFGAFGNALLVPPLMVARGMSALVRGEVRARHRPWPKWHRVADSPLMREREDAGLLDDSPLRALFEVDPRTALPAIRRWYSLRRLMLDQLAWLTLD